MYSPHIPGINVCNTELDWGSIFSGFSKLKVEADFQVRPSSSPPPGPLDIDATLMRLSRLGHVWDVILANHPPGRLSKEVALS